MSTVALERDTFNDRPAADIAASIDPRLSRTESGSARFACFADDERYLLVAGEQEQRSVELALAYGLAWAGGRRLLLALPHDMATATQQRIPWLREAVRPKLWLHDGRHAGPAVERTPGETVDRIGDAIAGRSPEQEFRRAATALHLGERADWVADLVDRLTADARLDSAHRQNERSWHYRGQRVLSMARADAGIRVRAGIHYSDQERAARAWELSGPLTQAELGDVLAAVDAAVEERAAGEDPLVRRDDEHLLQAAIRRVPAVVGIEQNAMREVPAWRPTDSTRPWARGFIDLLGLDGNGDIAVVETKVEKNADPLFVLQGLDYFVWAQAYRTPLVDRLGAASSARIRLTLAVGGQAEHSLHVPSYTRALAAGLDDVVPWTARAIRTWTDPAVRPTSEPLDLTP
ncbi:hypothetical protein ACI797_20025 [Geodermatophilus sp. SYSU D00691]